MKYKVNEIEGTISEILPSCAPFSLFKTKINNSLFLRKVIYNNIKESNINIFVLYFNPQPCQTGIQLIIPVL
jgi:hypothetical protein